MGEHQVEDGTDLSKQRAFVGALLNDLRALERMLDGERIEAGVRRAGAEQEMFLVDRHMNPALCAPEVIERVADPRVTSEIARFNLEADLTPRALTADCFRRMEEEIAEVVCLVREGARAHRPDDLVDLAASVMHWRHVRHVPVEDDEGRLVGLLSHRSLPRLVAGRGTGQLGESVTVRDIMKADPLTVSPQMPTLEAIDLMREHGVGCLPVVEGGALVGIVTAHDFLAASARLFEERLRATTGGPARGAV